MTTVRYRINDKRNYNNGNLGWPNWPGHCGQVGMCDNSSANMPLSAAHTGGSMVALADGSVRFLADGTDIVLLARACIRDDGAAITLP
jgi:prepilin-type processing-associated H-X9-DG protein